MTYLVDANVLSEGTKPSPDARVLEWLRLHEKEMAVDAVILGEVRYGILLLPAGQRRTRLESWFDVFVRTIRCLPWDAATGLRWAELMVALRKRGTGIPLQDGMIAATALRHGLKVATRNVRDFKATGAEVVNPFD